MPDRVREDIVLPAISTGLGAGSGFDVLARVRGVPTPEIPEAPGRAFFPDTPVAPSPSPVFEPVPPPPPPVRIPVPGVPTPVAGGVVAIGGVGLIEIVFELLNAQLDREEEELEAKLRLERQRLRDLQEERFPGGRREIIFPSLPEPQTSPELEPAPELVPVPPQPGRFVEFDPDADPFEMIPVPPVALPEAQPATVPAPAVQPIPAPTLPRPATAPSRVPSTLPTTKPASTPKRTKQPLPAPSPMPAPLPAPSPFPAVVPFPASQPLPRALPSPLAVPSVPLPSSVPLTRVRTSTVPSTRLQPATSAQPSTQSASSQCPPQQRCKEEREEREFRDLCAEGFFREVGQDDRDQFISWYRFCTTGRRLTKAEMEARGLLGPDGEVRRPRSDQIREGAQLVADFVSGLTGG